MNNSTCYTFVIIGGGIIGTSTAMALLKGQNFSVLVIEVEDKLAAHQTGNNSGVIHSGLYYKPGSLKAKNCTEGRELMYRFCEENDIPHENKKRNRKQIVVSDRTVETHCQLFKAGFAPPEKV